jgi:hypothetical protein
MTASVSRPPCSSSANPGIRPYPESGFGRLTPFDKLDTYRGNWWAAIPPDESTPTAALVAPPNLSFLSAGEKASAEREWASLSAIDGAEFSLQHGAPHAAVSPTDERVPEALSRCIGAVHLSPSNAHCDALAESAFHLLHRSYPKSEWVRKTKFYRGSGSP